MYNDEYPDMLGLENMEDTDYGAGDLFGNGYGDGAEFGITYHGAGHTTGFWWNLNGEDSVILSMHWYLAFKLGRGV